MRAYNTCKQASMVTRWDAGTDLTFLWRLDEGNI